MNTVDLVSVKTSDWREHKGEKVKFLTFADQSENTGSYNYMLPAKRNGGSDYEFSFDSLLKGAIAARTNNRDKIMIDNASVKSVGGRDWVMPTPSTQVYTVSITGEPIFDGKVSGTGNVTHAT